MKDLSQNSIIFTFVGIHCFVSSSPGLGIMDDIMEEDDNIYDNYIYIFIFILCIRINCAGLVRKYSVQAFVSDL